MRKIALWLSTNGAIAYLFVLPGSIFSITEITKYKYFSPLKPSNELKYESELNIVPLVRARKCKGHDMMASVPKAALHLLSVDGSSRPQFPINQI